MQKGVDVSKGSKAEEEGRFIRLVRISRKSKRRSRDMRTNRRRNWLIKRFALGLAVAAFVAPAAQARVDESSVVQAHTYQPVQANSYQAFATDFPSSAVSWTDPGLVASTSGHTNPHDWALNRGPQPHDPALTRVQLPSTSPVIVASRFGTPNATTSTELEAVDWNDVGMSAGLALALVLLGAGAALAIRGTRREQTA
jgi:hypothetical protein